MSKKKGKAPSEEIEEKVVSEEETIAEEVPAEEAPAAAEETPAEEPAAEEAPAEGSAAEEPAAEEAPAEEPAAAPEPVVEEISADGDSKIGRTIKPVNMRFGPTFGNAAIQQLKSGTEVTVLETVSGDKGKWYKCEFSGKTGYIMAAGINIVQ